MILGAAHEPAHRARLSRRRFLTGAASATALLCVPELARSGEAPAWSRDASAALARGHEWLWNAQSDGGRFPSATYGLLASGQSLTPFALASLLAGPRELLVARADRIHQAITAMMGMRNESGALGFATSSLDYPCYATGMMLSCLGSARPSGWQSLAAHSVDWLRSQQLRADDGWTGHPAQGGWGMGSIAPRVPPHAGHVDLSMTRRVIEGLRATTVARDDPALVEARTFVARCQTKDGSFVYSPVELALNKGLRDPGGRPLGYGSATTDGLLCLDALGLIEAPAFERGVRWLREHHRVDRNPGLDGGPMEPFAEAMRGYYRAGAAQCFARFGGPDGWEQSLAATIVTEQEADGSFRGTNGLQKEDDPIIGTAFAAQALAAALSSPRS
jgi:hypothetical protein